MLLGTRCCAAAAAHEQPLAPAPQHTLMMDIAADSQPLVMVLMCYRTGDRLTGCWRPVGKT
jgi:hypothetical protein